MKNAKEMFQKLKDAKFSSILKSVPKNLSESDLMTYIKTLPIVEAFERKELVKYLIENSDKTLVVTKYSEGDPVQVSDNYAPHASKHGKVMSLGQTEGHYTIKMNDGSVDELSAENLMHDNKAESEGIVTEEHDEESEVHESKGEEIFRQTGKGGQIITIEKEGEYFAMLRTVDGKIIDKQMFNSAQAAEHAILPYL